MTKYILLSIGITSVVIYSTISVLESSPSTSTSTVDTDAKRSYVSEKIFALGQVEGATPDIGLRPQVSGRLVKVLVHEGQVVQAGDVLLQLDDERYRYELDLAAADLDLAQGQLARLVNGASDEERSEAAGLYQAKLARLENARINLRRAEELRRTDTIAQREADDLWAEVQSLTAEVEAAKAHMETVTAPAREDDVRIAQARVKAARARLRVADVALRRTRLPAPSAGQLLKINVEPGELSGPTVSQPAIILADTSILRVRAFVEELDAPRVQVGMTAQITADGLPGELFTGRITHVSPRMGKKTLFNDRPAERHDIKTREILISLKDKQGLVVGLQVDVLIDVFVGNESTTL